MKILAAVWVVVSVLLLVPEGASAGGPFGAPQPLVREAGGLHTGIGYWFQEDRYMNGTGQTTRQNQIYSELGYGSRNGWEITARVGMSDLTLNGAFRSSSALTATARDDFEGGGKWFGSLGAKGFYPVSKAFGVGAFVQGTYSFNDLIDTVSGTSSGAPFSVGLRVGNFMELSFGMGLQATLRDGIKVYAGPHLRYSEFRISPSVAVAGIAHASGEATLKNRTGAGGFAGIELPLAKGFRLNLEGQHTERLSLGASLLYVY